MPQTSIKPEQNRMGTMPVNRLLISMSLPMIISMLVQAMYNIIDSIFVSRINEAALAAISMAFPIQSLMIAVSSGTCVGVNALLSRSLGEQNPKEAQKAAQNGIFLAVLGALAFALFGFFASRLYFASQTDDPEIIEYGVQYLQICLIFSIGFYMEMMLERIMQSTGRTIYNMFSQGINPELAIENIRSIAEVYERCTKMQIDPRHPYAGKLVFTAFSGSHQDAINKGIQALKERGGEYWEVPYLPIDPSDIGREYEPIVRINSQSGKGGVAFVMDTFYGFRLPKGMHKEFADVIQKISEQQGEVAPEQIMDEFRRCYLDKKEPLHFRKCHITDTEVEKDVYATLAKVTYTDHGIEKVFEGVGNGPIDAVQRGLEETLGIQIKVLDYNEHALRAGSNAQAASYIHLMDQESGKVTYGVGISSNITRASIRGIFSAVNRLFYS